MSSFSIIDGVPLFTIPRNMNELNYGECLMSEEYQEGDGIYYSV